MNLGNKGIQNKLTKLYCINKKIVFRNTKYLIKDVVRIVLIYCHVYEVTIDGVWTDDRIYWTL
jgi:hypothetical protein